MQNTMFKHLNIELCELIPCIRAMKTTMFASYVFAYFRCSFVMLFSCFYLWVLFYDVKPMTVFLYKLRYFTVCYLYTCIKRFTD